MNKGTDFGFPICVSIFTRIQQRLGEWSKAVLAVAALVLVMVASLPSSGQTVTTILSFDGSNAASPISGLVQGLDGKFYGTSYLGGGNNTGTVFEITAKGQLTTLYSFCLQVGCGDGSYPNAGLVLGTDGNFYGTTTQGGRSTSPYGSAFKITPRGGLTTLYSFCAETSCIDGDFPSTALTRGSDGSYYGTTYQGGSNNGGSVFKVSPKGQFTSLYSFCSQAGCADGEEPSGAGLLLGSDGNFYGVTPVGGANGNNGTVFRLTSAGKQTTLYSFCHLSNCTDGAYPQALVQVGTSFYGTTAAGGASMACGSGCGTVFKLTTAGKLTTLYSFCLRTNCPDGATPSNLVLATDGSLYGTTSQGGAFNGGSIFSITPTGKLTTLYSFCSQAECSDGSNPRGLMQATSGIFWGITESGGVLTSRCPSGCGTVFTLNAGLAAFIETVPGSGKVGATVAILGNSLNGSASVTFNGKPSTFKVMSPTEIAAMVPAGATSGVVQVVTPRGTLTSNVAFRVTQ